MEVRSAKFTADASQSIRSAENDKRFSDFTVQSGLLKFTWTSPQSGSNCKVSVFASDDYPENSLITLLWEAGDKETSCYYHAPVINLLEILGTDIQALEEQMRKDNEVLPATAVGVSDGIFKAVSSPGASDSVRDSNDASELSNSDLSDCSLEDMSDELCYHGYSNLMETETIGNGCTSASLHPLLVRDMTMLQAVYFESSLCYRFLNSIREVDLDMFIPLHFPNLTHQIAKAWHVNLEEPLVIRINLSSDFYLDMTVPPKIEVFQKSASGESCGIAHQMKNILQLFLGKKWQKLSNSDLQAAAVRSHSVPMNLSSLTRKQEQNADTHKAPAQAKSIPTSSSSSPILPSKFPFKFGLPSFLLDWWQGTRKADHTIQSVRTSYTEPNLSCTSTCRADVLVAETSTNSKEAPGLEDGFLVMLYRYAKQRISTLNEYCVVCDEPHIFQNGAMLKPAVCSRDLCVFAFQTLGLMADAACDISTGAEVVDLLIALTKAACRSSRRAIIFEPFPDLVDPNNPKELVFSAEKKDFHRLEQVLSRMPDMTVLVMMTTSQDMRTQLSHIDVLLFPLLTWIISSNRSHIVKLPAERLISFMVTPHQFLLLSSPPAKEAAFQAAKEKYGSTFAFHGSGIENWHSIIRQGLVVASNTPKQVNGAVHGEGIYLSPLSHMSFQYSSMGHSIHKLKKTHKVDAPGRFLATERLNCISLCEVIMSPRLRKKFDVWVCSDSSHVCTRFLFVYENGQVGDNVDMTLKENREAVNQVLSFVSHPF